MDAALHHGGAGTTGASLRGILSLSPDFLGPPLIVHRSGDTDVDQTLVRVGWSKSLFLVTFVVDAPISVINFSGLHVYNDLEYVFFF